MELIRIVITDGERVRVQLLPLATDDHRLSVAPMVDVTTRHFRMLIRCISPLPVVYSEMTWDRAVVRRGAPDFSAQERPIVLQLGGASPERLAEIVVEQPVKIQRADSQ